MARVLGFLDRPRYVTRPASASLRYRSHSSATVRAVSFAASRLNRIQATSTRGVRARIRRAAGCATPIGSAGHAGATANPKLTFHLDHSAGADQIYNQVRQRPNTVIEYTINLDEPAA